MRTLPGGRDSFQRLGLAVVRAGEGILQKGTAVVNSIGLIT